MNTTESTPAVPPDDEIPLEKEPIALEPLHSNSPDLRIDSKTVSPRSRSKGFCKIKIEVGAQQFTTTKTTMMGSRLFSSLFAAEEQAILPTPRTNMMSFIDNPNANTFDEFLVGLNVTSSVGKDEKKTEEPIGSGQIHHVESGHYFVDRSPVHFGRILHFLRNIRSVNADQFLERYYVSETMALGINSQCSGSTHNLYTLLLELQDEVAFYDIPSLFEAIEAKLSDEAREVVARSTVSSTALGPQNAPSLRMPTYFSRSGVLERENTAITPTALSGPSPRLNVLSANPDTSWMDRSGPLKGLRRIAGTRIAFATAMDNWVAKEAVFEAPSGYIWAKQSEYLDEYYKRRHLLSAMKEWVHFGVGGWDSYRWKYARKVAFIFADTFRSNRFVHSGMEISDINHVKSIFGLMSESPLMDYDESKGIVEGFAGLVLLSDDVYREEEAPPNDHQHIDVSPPQTVREHERLRNGRTDRSDRSEANGRNGRSQRERANQDNEMGVDHHVDVVDEVMAEQKENESTPNGAIRKNRVDVSPHRVTPDLDLDHDRKRERNRDDIDDVDDTKEREARCPAMTVDDDSDSDWTEDDEQQGHEALLSLREQHEKKVLKPATVRYPDEGPPAMANCFGDFTKKRRAALTKQNLQRHTQIETIKHSAQKQKQLQIDDPLDAALFGTGSPSKPTQHCAARAPRFHSTLQNSHSFRGPATHHTTIRSSHRRHLPTSNMTAHRHHQVPAHTTTPHAQSMQSPHFVPVQRQYGSGAAPSPIIYSTNTPPTNPLAPQHPVPTSNMSRALHYGQFESTTPRAPRPRPGLLHQLSINSLPPPQTHQLAQKY